LSRSGKHLLLGILLLAGLGAASAPARSSSWQENVSMRVDVGGMPSGTAHVYDSDDYQRMLLVFDDRPLAFLLDLGATSVFGVPHDSVHVAGEGSAEIGQVQGDLLTTLDQKEGILSFSQGDQAISVQPIPPLIGRATLERILELKPSYALGAGKYKPDPGKIAALKTVSADTEVRVFFGTWCLMCKRMLPGLIRTLDVAANPKIRATYIGVDEDLKEPAAEISASAVNKTPTVIVLQSGREIGRIEEEVTTSIEADLAAILAAKR